ncbi:uncharacterized protein BP5553_00115 [Venustampulla echinocandica]|uniref:MYND-type domain-containing protein n=1 Tax=Venustampulla echinocandica TaxID=2656787 RepID=A0A370TX76_9HELO|nr:uncharacterized protein BP5553_00115 [Venustampulla echinocandica]RDL40136.1 hypothetical protein BP5553_00115 [Venustampulla echinocandica]
MTTECPVCGKSESKLLRCGRCTSRVYCGPQCQKKDWATHKAEYSETLEDGDYCGKPGLQYRDDAKITLFQVLDGLKTKACTGRTDATAHFVCLEGEGHGCAEDVGGYHGWKELLMAYNAQNPTKGQKEEISWINTVLSQLEGAAGAASGSSSTLPTVLLVSLDKQPWLDEMYSAVLAKLRSKAVVTEVTHIASTLQHLSKSHEEYAAVVMTDPAVMEDKFIAVQEKLVDHARDGGTVILGFLFSALAQPDKLDKSFKDRWALNWKYSDYCRSMFSLNPRANLVSTSSRHPNLPHQYSMKAVHLRDTKPEDRIYVSDHGSAQSPAVLAKYGYGYLGWIGDVNTEIGTTEVLLAMCGV